MSSVIKIVNKIDAAPTTRLDLHDGTVWKCVSFVANPPKLRRAVSSNAMRDGVFVSSSSYDARTVQLELIPVKATADLLATELQKLARELDRTDNYLMYQEHGASKPVFFRWFRSEMTEVADLRGPTTAVKSVKVELLAEPFAIGLRERVDIGGVNQNPAASAPALYGSTGVILGDVPTYPIISPNGGTTWWTSSNTSMLLCSSTKTPTVAQAETYVAGGTDTTAQPNDANFSGAGNNYARCTFATTPTMATRLAFIAVPSTPGTYRIIARVRQNTGTDVIDVKAVMSGSVTQSTTKRLTSSTSFQMVDFGTFTWPSGAPITTMPYGAEYPANTGNAFCRIEAQRVSGAGTLDFDFIALIPVTTAALVASPALTIVSVLDAERDVSYELGGAGGDPFSGTVNLYGGGPTWTGRLPILVPGVTNYLTFMRMSLAQAIGNSQYILMDYFPKYLHVRPSAS